MLSIAVCDDEVLDCCKIAGIIKEILEELKQGIGLLNIREMVKKYHGIVSTKVEAHVFEISVLLPVNTHGHDRK